MRLPASLPVLLASILAACSIPANAGGNGSGGINAPEQRDKPYLILISIDGFRWDYMDLYETPALDRLAARGVRAESLEPVFPTLTFPNHYSIATGLYPANHGVVANDFPDTASDEWYLYKKPEIVQQGRWYGGEPIWVAAERSGMVAAAFFFVGTEADIDGIRPTYWHRFDYQISASRRVDQVLDWLAMPVETRPHMITLYFEHVDVDSHEYGIGSKESVSAIENIDRHLGMLLDGIGELPHGEDVYIVLVSDHGQSDYKENQSILVLDALVDLDGISIIEGGSFMFLFFDERDPARARQMRDSINGRWRHGRAWLPGETPVSWHMTNGSRFPDLIVQPDPHYGVVSSPDKIAELDRGDHGWNPSFKDMHGIFIAAGPRLPGATTLGTVSNLDIFPLMMEILGLPLTTAIDGDPDRLTRLLKP
ncbi:MAG: ectonucleotide pyrophosphatase/phosphodiesterase [Woeseia sp.]